MLKVYIFYDILILCWVANTLISQLKNKRPTWCHLLFYFTSYVLNMFRILIYPSSGACDCAVELPHRSVCSRFVVCWRFGVAGFEWCPGCRLQPATRTRTENTTTDVLIQQQSRKLLMMDILMSETCWVHKKWNKIASGIKLVFYSTAITMMHGPINIRLLCHSSFCEFHKNKHFWNLENNEKLFSLLFSVSPHTHPISFVYICVKRVVCLKFLIKIKNKIRK